MILYYAGSYKDDRALSTGKLARQKASKVEEKKRSKDQAGFELMTTAPSALALVRSANPPQRCWMPFFDNFIHMGP